MLKIIAIIVESELRKNNNSKKLIICTCSKSGCNKNYCECFKAKVKCNNKCRCIKCLNKPEDSVHLDENKILSKRASNQIPESFFQAFDCAYETPYQFNPI